MGIQNFSEKQPKAVKVGGFYIKHFSQEFYKSRRQVVQKPVK